MKTFAFVIFVTAVCILGISAADADERDTYCASVANHMNLTGKEREEFLVKCVMSSPEEKQKLEECVSVANHKNLIGQVREEFILNCMKR